ncbi:MAG TPA: citrate/2-methylcitrate synthase [Thermoplasmata archaeon]|nr:citrate/2-methylcitrate synthase [Thermoplasmata archaeon]
MVEPSEVQRGLQDVVALESRICFIDGVRGRLLYDGYDIRDLAARSTFEEVAYLLWYGRLPNRSQLDDLAQRFVQLRTLPEAIDRMLDEFPTTVHPMDVLRTTVSALALFEPDETKPGSSSIGGAQRLTAVLPTILGRFHRRRAGLPALEPRKELSAAAYLLYALLNREPSELEARALDVALILHADHELNASTFAARVTASTLSDLYSAVTSAIGTLKGPLHGGANERVMELLEEIGTVDLVEEVVKGKLSRHERIMGFGHRVYKVEDPRATILREWSRKLGEAKGNLRYFELLKKLEEVVHREKGLYPNVDLYSGSVYALLGIPRDLFTPIFAASRVAGWTAHVLEEYQDLRLIRPTAKYVGATDLRYVPIAERP